MSNKIKQYRIDHKLTQKQLAEYLGVTLRTIQHWEAGTRKPKKSIYMLLGISDEELSKLRKDGDDK
jgi:DNA-binding XRE family transcriptional regulator